MPYPFTHDSFFCLRFFAAWERMINFLLSHWDIFIEYIAFFSYSSSVWCIGGIIFKFSICLCNVHSNSILPHSSVDELPAVNDYFHEKKNDSEYAMKNNYNLKMIVIVVLILKTDYRQHWSMWNWNKKKEE